MVNGGLPMTCVSCDERDGDGKLSPAAKQLRDLWACDEKREPDDPVAHLLDDESMPLLRCPYKGALDEWAPLLPFFEFARQGRGLPVSGGMMDQAATFVAGLICYERSVAFVEAGRMEAARRDAAKKRRGQHDDART